MKKILIATLLILLVSSYPTTQATTINAAEKASVKVVKKYYKGENMYAVIKPLFVDVYSGPGTSYKKIRKIKRFVHPVIVEKMSNGWYRVGYPGDEKHYIDGKHVSKLVPDSKISEFIEPVRTFKKLSKKAPVPKTKVPSLKGKPTNNPETNLKMIGETLGFGLGAGRFDNDYSFAPNGTLAVSEYGKEVLTYNTNKVSEAFLDISSWDYPGVSEEEKLIPSTVREILRFYYPTYYHELYTVIYNIAHEKNMDSYTEETFYLDNRQVRFHYSKHLGSLTVCIGKKGYKYNSGFHYRKKI
ncbi:SH3 domain-containing protein [Bacillus sp. 31A1R]|uniref:SH3 domain-containing protein n=1 Tax=Robertmurraya mangrovi TaxID=3098077 RepID=A0ABU5J129_9BACI|nr:SH3 domain-containing protein [Bacillus sp. 31A1R]MDZ5473072.1 SH3 domain-containing protein [Bacillus sp. 31A1R]